MAAACREALASRVQVVTPPDQSGLVTFQPEEDAEAVVARLLDEGVVVRNIPGTPFVRASCGWWTNEDDVERLAGAL